MTQLLKHYGIGYESKTYAFGPVKGGIVYPKIEQLDVAHRLRDENGGMYFLSSCPSTLDYTKIVDDEGLTNIQNDVGVTTYTYIQLPPPEEPGPGIGTTIPVYEVSYTKIYTLEPKLYTGIGTEVGLWILTEGEWNNEIVGFDSSQTVKRVVILRSIRNALLDATDWFPLARLENELTVPLTTRQYRQSLRDLPQQNPFPTQLPEIPTELDTIEVRIIYKRWNELFSISMINDPLVGIATT